MSLACTKITLSNMHKGVFSGSPVGSTTAKTFSIYYCFSTSFIRLQDILSEAATSAGLEIRFWNNGFLTAFPLLIIMCFTVVILA